MTKQEQLFEQLKAMFGPVAIKAAELHAQEIISNHISVAQIDLWIRLAERSGAGRIKKLFVVTRLKHHRKAALKGKKVTLMKKEKDLLLKEAAKRIPRLLVRHYLDSLLAHARENGDQLELCSFDDTMRPFQMKPMEMDEKMMAGGLKPGHVSDMLKNIHPLLKQDEKLPKAAAEYLEIEGVKFVQQIAPV